MLRQLEVSLQLGHGLVYEDFAVEMIHFVLNGAAEQISGYFLLDFFAGKILVAHDNTRGPFYLEEHALETQTALETDHFAVCFKQDRIDENNRAARSVGGRDVDNHQLLGDPDLRSRKSNAVVGIHGIEHVLSQLA